MVSQFRLCTCTEFCGYKGLCLVQCAAAEDFKFLIIYEQCTPHFHFVLGSDNYVACSGTRRGPERQQEEVKGKINFYWPQGIGGRRSRRKVSQTHRFTSSLAQERGYYITGEEHQKGSFCPI